MKRLSQPQRYFYQSIADRFDSLDNPYDLSRRLAVIFDDLLAGCNLRDQLVLDAGCGYGPFSRAIADQRARVISCDIAEKLVKRTLTGTGSSGVVCDAGQSSFRNDTFDWVISSEMIEHTESPDHTLRELARVLKPGGCLALTTPNKVWQWLVRLGSRLNARPFHGLENFVGWNELENLCLCQNLKIVRHIGFHPWPFQIRLWKLSEAIDARFGQSRWATVMINQGILACKTA